MRSFIRRVRRIVYHCQHPSLGWMTCQNWWCSTQPWEGSCNCKVGPEWLRKLDPAYPLFHLVRKIKDMTVKCTTCKRPAIDCRNVCSSLQPMIDLLTEKWTNEADEKAQLIYNSQICILRAIQNRGMERALKDYQKV